MQQFVTEGQRMSTNLTNMMFTKSLQSMVKGIRQARERGVDHEQQYITKCLSELRVELQSKYPDTKGIAISKLIYLQMLGYDMSSYCFSIVECMSSQWYGYKRLGYLAAQLVFNQQTDVILLTTHLFRKAWTGGISSGGPSSGMQPAGNMLTPAESLQYEQGSAISCFANIVTPELGADLLNDLYQLLNSSRPYIRKKTTLALLNVVRVYPEALTPRTLQLLHERLQDDSPGVVSAAVYVTCELSIHHPVQYLSMVPTFFHILTTSSNNWVLIKVVKLLGHLVPYELRLVKKLQQPLIDIITTTPAKSLLYECINTLLSGEIQQPATLRLVIDKLKIFVEDTDQNLKYLGLLGFHKLQHKHPQVMVGQKDLVLECLTDDDVTIRVRALDLITQMVNQRNITSIVRRMVELLSVMDGIYRDHVLLRLLEICKSDNYSNVVDFEWLITMLFDLTTLHSVSYKCAVQINSQILDVVVRVPDVRQFAVQRASKLLVDRQSMIPGNAMTQVLYSAAFIVGEYSEHVSDHQQLITALTDPNNTLLPANVQQVFIQAAVKLMLAAMTTQSSPHQHRSSHKQADLLNVHNNALTNGYDAAGKDAADENKEASADASQQSTALIVQGDGASAATAIDVTNLCNTLSHNIESFTVSQHVEVQERAVAYNQLVKWVLTLQQADSDAPVINTESLASFDPHHEASNGDVSADTNSNDTHLSSLLQQLSAIFAEPLNPVNFKAQRKVPPPKDLDLDQPINAQWDYDSDADVEQEMETHSQHDDTQSQASGQDRSTRRGKRADDAKARTDRQKRDDPFYLKEKQRRDKTSSRQPSDDHESDIDNIPIQQLNVGDIPEIESTQTENKSRRQRRKTKAKASSWSDEEDAQQPRKQYNIVTTEDMPSDAEVSDREDKTAEADAGQRRRSKRDQRSKKEKRSKAKQQQPVDDADDATERHATQLAPNGAANTAILSLDLFDPLAEVDQTATTADHSAENATSTVAAAGNVAPAAGPASGSSSASGQVLYRDSLCKLRHTDTTVHGSDVRFKLAATMKPSDKVSSYAVAVKAPKHTMLRSDSTGATAEDGTVTLSWTSQKPPVDASIVLTLTKPTRSALTLPVTIKRVADSGKASKEKQVTLTLPLCTFIAPTVMSSEEFAELMVNAAADLQSASTKVTSDAAFASAVNSIAQQCHLHVVEASNDSKTLLGTWQSELVTYSGIIAMLLKQRPSSNTLSITVRSKKESAAQKVVDEVTALLSQ